MSFFGIDLFLGKQDDLINEIIKDVKIQRKENYFAINPDCFLKFLDVEGYREMLLNKKNTVYVDGMGIIFAQKLLKIPVAQERIATTDLFPALLSKLQSEQNKASIYLLGGKGATTKRVIEKFSIEYPDVNFVGSHHGYYKSSEEEKIINEINALNVDILFVGFGNPKQELWVKKNFDKLNVKAFITCGGLFDYYSGNVKRAPLFLRKTGFEWLYRLIQEPRRLFKRYIFGNSRYITYMLWRKVRGKKYHD